MRGVKSKEPKLGVVLCTCDGTIGENIDFDELEKRIKERPDLIFVSRHDKLCTKEGQDSLKEEISSKGAKRVVIAACTPRTYGELLKRSAIEGGINEYLVEQVNIREQCDWIHQDKKAATDKAVELIMGGIGRVIFAISIEDKTLRLARDNDVLIIGGGLAGIASALELMKKGINVHLVERSDKLGGKAYDLDFEALKEQNIALPSIDELTGSEKVDVMLESEVGDITGTLGDYHIDIKTKDGPKELVVGGIVVATGSDLFDAGRIPEYLYEDDDVIDFFQLEKMLAAKDIKVPSTGEVPKRMNFIQCVGSRDENKGNHHCSLVCCTYAISQAKRIKSLNPETEVFVHYMDLRGPDNGFEEDYLEAQRKGVYFIRGRTAEILRDNGNLTLRTEHIELGEIMAFKSDMVVLALGQEATEGTEKLAEMVHLPLDVDGFMGYYNDRYDIIDRRGISLAGCVQGPSSIKKTLSDAKKSAFEVAQILKEGLKVRSIHSVIDEPRCVGCRLCEELCPYGAISMKTVKNHITQEVKLVSSVDLATCQGCGACAMACPGGVPELVGFSNKEILAQIDEVC